MNIYMKASKENLKFDTNKGFVSLNSLWTIPLELLDEVVINLKNLTQKEVVESYLKLNNSEDLSTLKFSVAEGILLHRIKEKELEERKVFNKNQKQRILQIITSKEDKFLEDQDLTSLKTMLGDLEIEEKLG